MVSALLPKTNRITLKWICRMAIWMMISIVWGTSSWAAGADDLLKAAQKELGNAQRNMFSCKTEQAIAGLQKAQELIEQAKASDPNNKKIKGLESKAGKLCKDLERRTGKDLGGGTLSSKKSAPAPAAKPAASKPASKPAAARQAVQKPASSGAATKEKLPYNARKYFFNVDRDLNNMERYFDQIAKADRDDLKKLNIKHIENGLKGCESNLKKAREEAAKKGVNAHPKFDDAEKRIAGYEERLKKEKGGFEQAQAEQKAKGAKVQADADAMRAEYDRLRDFFNKTPGTVIYYNDIKAPEKLIGEIENFEKNDLAGVKDKIQAFEAKYGTDPEKIEKEADAAGYASNSGYDASYGYRKLSEGIAKVAKTRTVMAEDLIKRMEMTLEHHVSGGHDFFVLEGVKDARAWLKLAERYDAGNPKVKQAVSEFDARAQKCMADFNAKVDNRKWPAHAANAPGNAKSLAKAALDYFKNDVGWGKRDQNPRAKDKEPRIPVAVSVRGPWSVQKKNILGEPIMWGLPVFLAVELESEKPMKVMRVFNLTLRTQEAKGVKKAPPFFSATVGDSWYIRPNAVK